MRRGFSLVELSIVLVILGLLVGGVLAGQSLIRASELRAVGTEHQKFMTATHAFRDKYFALPGDMANATSFWGKNASYCNSHSGTAATPGTCNGNADGIITESPNTGYTTGEMYQFWHQLSLAGLIDGSYTGLSGIASHLDSVLGVNSPASKIANVGWTVLYRTTTASSSFYASSINSNMLYIGKKQGATASFSAPFLKAEEAWNIDTKLDDGVADQGKVNAVNRTECATGGAYDVTNTAPELCGLCFPRVF